MALYGAPVEYAIHTLLNLCLGPEDAAPSAKDLAEFQRLPAPFMRKLLTRLEKAGLVRGAKGFRGGWQLARDAAEISLLAIADAAQGSRPKLFDCKEIRARCALWPDGRAPAEAVRGVCEIHAAMIAAERAMREALAGQSLADIATRVAAKSNDAAPVVIKEWFQDRYGARRTEHRGRNNA